MPVMSVTSNGDASVWLHSEGIVTCWPAAMKGFFWTVRLHPSTHVNTILAPMPSCRSHGGMEFCDTRVPRHVSIEWHCFMQLSITLGSSVLAEALKVEPGAKQIRVRRVEGGVVFTHVLCGCPSWVAPRQLDVIPLPSASSSNWLSRLHVLHVNCGH